MDGQVLDEEAAGTGQWQVVTPSGWRSYGRPSKVDMDTTTRSLAGVPATIDAAQSLLEGVLGGERAVFDVKGVPVLVDAAALAGHMTDDLARAAYFPQIFRTGT